MREQRFQGKRCRGILAVVLLLTVAGCVTTPREERATGRNSDTPTIWPVAYPKRVVTSEFGPRRNPRTHQREQHKGIDIAAPEGTPVVATARGEVVFSGVGTGYGKIIKIDHRNGIQTWYAHLSARKVKVGKKVDRGQLIGKVGMSGDATGPNLHYEIHVNGRLVNPRRFLP